MDKVRCGSGWVLMAPCPGRPGGPSVAQVAEADAVVTLLGDAELARLGVADLGAQVAGLGRAWVQAPIGDFSAPDKDFEDAWAAAAPALHAVLEAGGTVAVHCRAGLGRTGTVAARLLVERGASAAEAVAAVRAARPGTLETGDQVAHVHAVAAKMKPRED